MNSLKGHCLCGSVQYEIKGKPQFSFLCQCRQCQRITGSGHSAEFAVPDEITSITDELKCYDMKSDNGNTISSEFCSNCGNPVLKRSSGYPGLLFFHAATLENPALFKPQKVFWASSSQPWDFVDPELEIKQNA
jgi:hypothetical protein